MSDLNQQQTEALGRMMVEGFRKSDAAIVEGCLKRGADPDVLVADGSGPLRPVLHWGVQYFNEAGLKAMLDYGANIEARDPEGETALFHAIRSFKTESVEFLMKHGADPVAQNNSGVVALDVARGLRTDYDSYEKGRARIIRALTADYGGKQPVQDDTPPAVTFGQKQQKPGANKFSV